MRVSLAAMLPRALSYVKTDRKLVLRFRPKTKTAPKMNFQTKILSMLLMKDHCITQQFCLIRNATAWILFLLGRKHQHY